MVTGTTASSGDHSIITGVHRLAGRFLRQPAEKFGVAGLGKARRGRARSWRSDWSPRPRRVPASTSATARRIEAIAAGALVASGLPGAAVTGRSSGTTGSARAKASPACAGVTVVERHVEAERARARLQEIRRRRSDRRPAGRVRAAAARPRARDRVRCPPARRASAPERRLPARSFVFDHRATCGFLPGIACDSCSNRSAKILLRNFSLGRRFGLARLLVAEREHLQALRGHLRRGQAGRSPSCRAVRAVAAPDRPSCG